MSEEREAPSPGDQGTNTSEGIKRRLEQLREQLKAAGGRPVLSDEEWRSGGASVRGPRPAPEPSGRREDDAGVAAGSTAPAVEPPADVFDEPGQVTVVAEMPGVGPEDLDVIASADRVVLATKPGARRAYHTEVRLPSQVDPESLHWSYRNGVLELRLTKRHGAGS